MIFPKCRTNKWKVNCATCEEMPNQNIHYKWHMIAYLDSKYNIDRLPMGIVWIGYFEKAGWIV